MWQVHGYSQIVRQLDSNLREGRYAHAYLLAGPPRVGKRTLALQMAQAVNCLSPEDAPCHVCSQCRRIASAQHSDVLEIGVHKLGDDGAARKEIGIDDVRDVQRQASLKPYEGEHRVFIFDGAELMSEEASNALLKTLEEPPPQVLLILLTCREESVIPTIRSRCRMLELRPLPLAEVANALQSVRTITEPEAKRLAHLSDGCLGWAISAVDDPSFLEEQEQQVARVAQLCVAPLEDRFSYAADLASLARKDREEAREALCGWLRWWRDLLLVKEGAEEFVHNIGWSNTLHLRATGYSTAHIVGFIRSILSTLEGLDYNANARLALEALMLSLPRERAI